METADNANQADYRIFGWDEQGRLRAVLYHGAGHPYAGARYSSVFGATVYALADIARIAPGGVSPRQATKMLLPYCAALW